MSKLNKIIITIFLLFLIFLPTNIFALSSDYKDVVHEIVGEKEVKDKVTIYFFHGYSCPHCKEETGFLDQLEKKYDGKILIRKYETWKEENKQNAKWANEVRHHFGITREGVPLTVVGEKYYSGYSDVIGYRIEKQIDLYLAEEESDDDQEKTIVESNKYKIPILGEIDVTKASIFLIAVVLGFIDGFNPCAMWVLLFIINMLLGMEDKKKMFILGFAFLFTSAFIYFLSMLGISLLVFYDL